MRRMFSKKQILDMGPESIKGKDINVEGITSKGIANTGDIGNIGDVAISGDLSVSGSINGEENPSIKPIYIHPITILQPSGTTTVYSCSFFIFNQNANPYDTMDKLVNALYDVFDNLAEGETTARFPCSGSVKNASGDYQINSTLEITGKETSLITIIGVSLNPAATTLTRRQLSELMTSRIFDGVNKIN